MNRPHTESQSDSTREANVAERENIGDRKASGASTAKGARPTFVASSDPIGRYTPRREVIRDPRSDRPEVAVRVSVIDGADRLVYTDLGYRRGRTQPLSAEQAASEFRHPSAAGGVVSAEPRTVRTLEMARPFPVVDLVDAVPRTRSLTPYGMGKAAASSDASAPTQRTRGASGSQALPGPSATIQPTLQSPGAPSRSR